MTLRVRSLLVALALPFGGACALLTEAPAAAPEDARAADLWHWCPAPSYAEEVVEERIWLQFSDDALYCTLTLPSWDSGVSAWTQLDDKAQLRLVPADNFLPKEAGEHDVTLPLCARGASAEAPSAVQPGRLLVERSDQLGRTRVSLSYLQTVYDEDGAARTAYLRVSGYEEDLSAGLLLDGAAWPLPDPDVRMALCAGERCAPEEPMALLDSCDFDGPRELHELRFDGGNVSFVLEAKADRSPLRAHLMSATGALDTFPFEQRSFWRLVGRESWPYSGARDIAVAFDEPVAGVCGILATQLYADSTSGSVELKLCDGGNETRTILSHSVELEGVDAGPDATP